ncbi:hypothetical protein KJ966_04030 [bacterium]|nr:hypothetical protein [bacterium]
MYYYPGENWYALRVKTRYETIVEKALETKKVEALNFTYQELSKRKDRKKILTKAFFPGYMFIKAELNPQIHVEILKSIGVVEILKNSDGPLPIPQDQIDNVLKLEKYEGKVLTFTEFACGMPVRIIQGPLLGVQGFVDEINRGLIKISISSVPGSVAIQVDPSLIEPILADRSLSSMLH